MAGGRYRILMERYQHIIRSSLFGHTHDQYFGVTNAMSDPTKHIGVAQIGPAATTMSWENPGYGVLTIDKETMLPMNWEIYGMDLMKANNSGTPVWEVMTDYVRDYELLNKNVSPDSMYDLGMRIAEDRTLASLFQWNETRNVKEP